MRNASLLWSACAIAAVLASAGCEPGAKFYRSEATAQASCPDDVVVAVFNKFPGAYYMKGAPMYNWNEQQIDYACYREMVRLHIPCNTPHDLAEGPPPRANFPACYSDPRAPPL
jgi:hypothetical protein